MSDDEAIYLVDDLIMPAEEHREKKTLEAKARALKYLYFVCIVVMVAGLLLCQAWHKKA